MTRALASDAPDIEPAVLKEAADWLMRLHSGEPGAVDDAALQRWLNTSPQHRSAWQRAEQLLGGLQAVPTQAARAALDRPPGGRSRRGAIARLVWLPMLPTAAWLGWSQLPWREWQADFRTATGEHKRVTLADGTLVLLNTASALNVRYTGEQRLLRLLAGEVFITTAPDRRADGMSAPPRPFLVQTTEGTVQALGTRFTVRHDDAGRWGESRSRSHVAVFEGAVEIAAGHHIRRLNASERADFSGSGIGPISTVDEALEGAWRTGMLIARRMRLADLAAELDRYRPGLLRCSSEVAELRISGAFPLLDPERSLRLLAETFPVRVHYRSRYWATLVPV